jgi:hypothetical protein
VWAPAGQRARLIVATEANVVYALDAATGAVVWQTQLPAPVPRGQLACGNIDPEGIDGTPVIDPASATVFLDALTETNNGPRQMLFALALANGSIRPGWPLDVGAMLAAQNVTFSSTHQGERSALLLFGGRLYVVYGGKAGDCLPYHGVVLELAIAPPRLLANWVTRAQRGGIWSQGGISSDGTSLFVTTGNTFQAVTWGDGEAIIRLRPGLAHSTDTADFFTPSDWKTLDSHDTDLGGTEALPIMVPNGTGGQVKRIIALGKDGNAYLVDRNNLGGIGGALATAAVSSGPIITAAAVYETRSETLVAFTNKASAACPTTSMTMLRVGAGTSTPIQRAWCTPLSGKGAPIITTTDGTNDALVWVVGAQGDGRLHGFDAHTGAVVADGGGTVMSGLHHFQTLIGWNRHFYVAADGTVYAFAY